MANKPSMRSLVADALEPSDPDGTVDTEAADEEAPTPDASEGGQLEGTTDDTASESEAPEGTEELVGEYFGLDLTSVEPDVRAEILGELRKRDDYIGKLLREPEPVAPVETAEGEEDAAPEVTDQDILAYLGVDAENDPFAEEAAKIAVPLIRQQMEMQQSLNTLLEAQELAELDRSWRSSLSGLEREFTVLPPGVDHERVMQFAADEGINNPVDAYWRIMGPGRAAAARSLEAEQAKADKLRSAKRASSSTRPGASDAQDDIPVAAKTIKDATKEAARKLFADLGYDT